MDIQEAPSGKSDSKTVDLASPLLERSWRSQLGAKSILDLPVELIWLIERNSISKLKVAALRHSF